MVKHYNMDKKMIFYYDKDDDLLDISVGKPKKSVSTEIADDFFIRKNLKTGKITGFTILNFEKWFKEKNEEKEVPLTANFSFVSK